MTETGHSDSIAENSELSLRGDFIKKYWSSGGVFCYQTSLIRHGGVTSKGPLLQRSSTESPKTLTISSKPLVLDIRPLSDYQQTLIDRSGPVCLNSDLSILSGISADSHAASLTVGSITA